VESQRIEQIVVIALLVMLAVGCITVLRPFLSALLWGLILSFSSWPLYAWLVGGLQRRRELAASGLPCPSSSGNGAPTPA
jgi:predicted PurR-regulated permease PerM